jgi:hypothetical protein
VAVKTSVGLLNYIILLMLSGQHVIRGPQLGVLVREGLHGEHCGGAVVPGSRQDLCGGLCYNEEEAQGDISHLNK